MSHTVQQSADLGAYAEKTAPPTVHLAAVLTEAGLTDYPSLAASFPALAQSFLTEACFIHGHESVECL